MNKLLDELLEEYPDVPVLVEAWMSKKIQLLAEAVGYEAGNLLTDYFIALIAGFDANEPVKHDSGC